MQDESEGFVEFWRVYPRRVGKLAAIRAYKKALRLSSWEAIVRGAIRYAHERGTEDPTYTKHPATWLNGGCWDDEAAPQRQRPGVIGSLDRLDAYLSEADDHPVMLASTESRDKS